MQHRFINNITTSFERLLIDVVFTTLLHRRDIVERRRDVKTATIQRRYDVVCLLGYILKVYQLESLSYSLSVYFQTFNERIRFLGDFL